MWNSTNEQEEIALSYVQIWVIKQALNSSNRQKHVSHVLTEHA